MPMIALFQSRSARSAFPAVPNPFRSAWSARIAGLRRFAGRNDGRAPKASRECCRTKGRSILLPREIPGREGVLKCRDIVWKRHCAVEQSCWNEGGSNSWIGAVVGCADVRRFVPDLSYQFMGEVDRTFLEGFKTKVGYRHLSWDYENGGARWHVAASRRYPGLGIQF